MTPSKSYTTGQVAKLCDVSQRTVINWIERGALAARKLPGRGDRRVDFDALREFMLQHTLPLPEAWEASGEQVNNDGGARVLVVDDDVSVASSIRRVLYSDGLKVEVVHDGFAAGFALARHMPEVMILDLNMPGLNGLKVLEMMRDKGVDTVKVLVLSAAQPEELNKARELGASCVMSKPFDNDELLAQVKYLLDLNGVSM